MSQTLTIPSDANNQALIQFSGGCNPSKSALDFDFGELAARIERVFQAVYGNNQDPLGFIQNAPGAVGRSVTSKLRDAINVRDFMKDADGTNVVPALQAIHDGAAVMSLRVAEIPGGEFTWGGQLNVTFGFSIIGSGAMDAFSDVQGTRLVISDTTINPVVCTGVQARGFRMEGLAWEQVHAPFAPGWQPTVYPDVITVNGVGGVIVMNDIMLLGIYSFMSCVSSGRTFWDRVWGQVYKRGIYIDQSLDCPHFRNLHFWPFVSEGVVGRDPTHSAVQWSQQNGDIFEIARCDNPFVDNMLGFGMRSVFHITQSGDGSVDSVNAGYGTLTSSQIGAFTADACKWPIWIDSTVTIGAFFTAADVYLACEALDGTPIPNGSCVLIEGRGNVQISQYRMYLCAQSPVRCTSATLASVVNLGQGSMIQCAKDSTTAAPVPYIFMNQCGPGPHQLQLNSVPQTDLGALATQLCNWDTSNFIFKNCTGVDFDFQVVNHIANNDQIQMFNNRHTLYWGGGDGTSVSGVTLHMPPNPVDGELRRIVPLNPISSITFDGGYPAGPTYPPVIGAPSSASPHNEIIFQFLCTSPDGTGNHWRCRTQGRPLS